MIRGAIFDLGSTLIQYSGDGPATYAQMRADLADHLLAAGLAFEREAFLTTFVERQDEFHAQHLHDWVEVTLAYVLRETLSTLGHPPLEEAAMFEALKVYFAYGETLWGLMPEAHATLDLLQARGYRLGMISNAPDDANVQRLIDNAGLRAWFNPIIVSAAVGIRKPNPRIFEMVLEAWGFEPAEVVMVGDTLGADVLGAQLTGLRSVWIDSRPDTPANEAHRHTIRPDATIYSLAELPAVLDSFTES